MNLSFAGCGFLGIYHVGVAVCFKKYAPHLLLGKISGASFGALSACCLLCELPIGEITSDVLRVVGEARAGSLGPFSPSFNIQNVLLDGMHKYLPHDVHHIVSGKLHISLTRVYDGKNVIVSDFPTRDDLLQALLASCFVPVFSGLVPPRFHGVRYMDGGFSDNLPVLDENTITVSPFCGESDICPRDLSSQLFHVNVANTSIELSRQNMCRFARILFPPRAEVLSSMCKQGFDDALRFLQRNELISCTRCLALDARAALLLPAPDCDQCRAHRQDALVDDLPDTVMTIFQDAIDSANSGIVNWVMRRRAVRYLTLLTLPYRVPVDIVYATFTNYVCGRVERHEAQYAAPAPALAWRRARCALHQPRDARLARSTPRMSAALWRAWLAALQQLRSCVWEHASHHPPRYQLVPRLSPASPASSASSALHTRRGSAEALQQLEGVTSHRDALLAYFYLDEHDQLNVTEIYDVTEADTDEVQSPAERDLNKQLQFDNDWGGELLLRGRGDGDADELDADELDADDALADRNIFSDPESEWLERRSYCASDSDGDQPEADRRAPHAL